MIPFAAVFALAACGDDAVRTVVDRKVDGGTGTGSPKQDTTTPNDETPTEEPSTPAGELVVKEFGGVQFEFSFIPAGTFHMGAKSNDPDAYPIEQPSHEVTLSTPFLMLRNEVTQEQYEAVMGTNPSSFTGDPSRPVENVSWEEAFAFCMALNNLEPNAGYRLPTEAEWEYAARAGTTGPRYANLDASTWYWNNSAQSTQPVMTKLPNEWNLYDMLGNVAEWTADLQAPYTADPVSDPMGAETGSFYVYRGGSWNFADRYARVTDRQSASSGTRRAGIGFRPVMYTY